MFGQIAPNHTIFFGLLGLLDIQRFKCLVGRLYYFANGAVTTLDNSPTGVTCADGYEGTMRGSARERTPYLAACICRLELLLFEP